MSLQFHLLIYHRDPSSTVISIIKQYVTSHICKVVHRERGGVRLEKRWWIAELLVAEPGT